MCMSMTPGDPRLGPRIHHKILKQVCSDRQSLAVLPSVPGDCGAMAHLSVGTPKNVFSSPLACVDDIHKLDAKFICLQTRHACCHHRRRNQDQVAGCWSNLLDEVVEDTAPYLPRSPRRGRGGASVGGGGGSQAPIRQGPAGGRCGAPASLVYFGAQEHTCACFFLNPA